MGYSIHTPCKTKKARNEMLFFLGQNYRPFSVLAAGSGCLSEIARIEELNDRTWEHRNELRGPLGDDLSYVHGAKWYIGFDFGTSSGGQGHWMKDVCRWMATKVGRLHQFGMIEGKVPYIVYDIPDDEEWETLDSIWPVLERSEFDVTKDLESFVVDRGFRGWAQQVRESRAHIERTTMKRCNEKNWSPAQYKVSLAQRNKFWSHQMRIAKRADKYIKAELARLDDLWENR